MCVWCVFTSSRLPVPSDSVTQYPKQQVKIPGGGGGWGGGYPVVKILSIAMHSACSEH